MKEERASPFRTGTVFVLLLFGALAFLSALYFIGSGEAGRGTNNGGAHAGGKGLNGFAALASLMEARGWDVTHSSNKAGLQSEDLVVLTPPMDMDGAELAELVTARRHLGPTIVILPKWQAYPPPRPPAGAGKGWVILDQPRSPQWRGFEDETRIAIGAARGWQAGSLAGTLRAPKAVQSAEASNRLVPLVVSSDDPDRILAAQANDGGGLPLVFVFEPDLLDNMGLAQASNAILADGLLNRAASGRGRRVLFDLTLNGFGRTPNLLTLAFTPPFLAATLCLLLAAFAIAWRAFNRFGPPLREQRQIAFGKAQLVRNSAGIILRTGRFHLLGRPYAELVHSRMAKLRLRHRQDEGEAGTALDAALAARGVEAGSFTIEAERLRAARKPNDVLRAAQALQQLERTLDR